MAKCFWNITVKPTVKCSDDTEDGLPLCEFHMGVIYQMMEDFGVTAEDLEPPNGVAWTAEDVRRLIDEAKE